MPSAHAEPFCVCTLPPRPAKHSPSTRSEPRLLGLGVVPVRPLRAVVHLLLEGLDLRQLPPADEGLVVLGRLAAAQRDGAPELALVVVVLPLEAVVLRVAERLAVVGRLGGRALDLGQLVPLASVEVRLGVGPVALAVGEVGPVLPSRDERVLDEVIEDVLPEYGILHIRVNVQLRKQR